MAQKKDTELLTLCVENRSEEAFSELCRRYSRLIFNTCLREIGDRSLAEDATQGVFLLLSQKVASLRGRDTLAGWLYTASRYVSKNLIKHERRRRLLEERATLESMAENKNSSGIGNPLWDQIEPHFNEALSRLKSVDRDAILLRFVQEQSFGDVGVNLGISENTARMRVNRALEKIKSHLSRVGIAVSVAILAVLIQERSAQAATLVALPKLAVSGGAATVGVAPKIVKVAEQSMRQLALTKLAYPLIGLAGLLVVGLSVYRILLPAKMSFSESQAALRGLTGDWSGQLEYEDASSKKRVQYAVSVKALFDATASRLNFVSTYPAGDWKDVYTISLDPASGSAFAKNVGTYRLNADGALYRNRNGAIEFTGKERGSQSDLRVSFKLIGNRLEKLEEYRKPGGGEFVFRHRYSLQK